MLADVAGTRTVTLFRRAISAGGDGACVGVPGAMSEVHAPLIGMHATVQKL